MKGALAWQVTHSIKYYFLCRRGDGTAIWPGSPLRVCVCSPLFFFFFSFRSYVVIYSQSRKHLNYQQLNRHVRYRLSLVTTILNNTIPKNHQNTASKFNEQAYFFPTSTAHRESQMWVKVKPISERSRMYMVDWLHYESSIYYRTRFH
ncbi:hypothetical protein ACP275_03G062500 [Erythranthe tilingii]